MTSEFELIDRFLRPFAREGAGLVLGPGDDCAVLRPGAGRDLCVTTDAIVERVHFDPDLFSDADIGHKALAVNLSDVASMGATARWFVCSIACPATTLPRIPGIARGMAKLAARAGVVLAGGNFSRADQLSIHITAAGEVPRGRALRRSGARAGDVLFVSGTLGDAALALRPEARPARAVTARQRRPEPRLELGCLALDWASAAIDISDGLVQDLGHVAKASGIGVRLDAARVPVSRAFRASGAAIELALTGGEDYELALFVPGPRAAGFERACRRAGHAVTRVGEATAGGFEVLGAAALDARGHDHFAGAGRSGPRSRSRRATPGRQSAN